MFLTFRSFSTEPRWDYVEIRDTMNTSHVIGHFSGSQIPPVVVSCGSSLNVTFVSDGSVTMDGFAASFESRSKRSFYKTQTHSHAVAYSYEYLRGWTHPVLTNISLK